MIDPTDFLNRADELGPVPDQDAKPQEWVRHFACQAMAASAGVRALIGAGRGHELAYLALLSASATAAAVALTAPAETAARVIWELTPEAGALNGEWIDHLADTLEAHGINPADLYPWYEASDFTSPAQLPPIEVP